MAAILALAPAPALAQGLNPPDAASSYRTHALVEGWVQAGDVPATLASDAGVPAVQGASITVSLDGQVVGRGADVAFEPAAEVVRRAAGKAVRGIGADITTTERARLVVSVELSGAFVPYHADTIEELALGLSPGLEGVALATSDSVAAAFPGAMLARGVGPAIALVGLVNQLGDDAQDALASPKELRGRGYTIYRFRAVHLAQPGPGAGAVFVHRGGRVIEPHEISTRSIGAMGDAMAGYLMASRWPGVEGYGMLGTQHPTSGRYDPPFAGTVEQAVAAMALLRYARVREAYPSAGAARLAAVGVLETLNDVEENERSPWADAHGSAAVILALAELGPDAIAGNTALSELHGRCRETLHGAYTPADGYAEGLPQPAWGLIAGALVADHARLGDTRLSPAQLDRAVRAVYRDTGPAYLVGQMPWLGWAELELAGVTGRSTPAAPALRSMRRLTWDHQLRTTDLAHEDRDLAGGVVFTRAATPLPTWHATRPLAFIATMLGDETFTRGSPTSGEVPGELVKLLASLRFVRQLMADDSTAHMYARPARTVGGVRAALWDQAIAPEATAMGLLTVCETLDAMDAMRERMPAADAGGG